MKDNESVIIRWSKWFYFLFNFLRIFKLLNRKLLTYNWSISITKVDLKEFHPLSFRVVFFDWMDQLRTLFACTKQLRCRNLLFSRIVSGRKKLPLPESPLRPQHYLVLVPHCKKRKLNGNYFVHWFSGALCLTRFQLRMLVPVAENN